MTRYVTAAPDTDISPARDARVGLGRTLDPDLEPTPPDAEDQDPEQWRLYRLCPCGDCNGTGKDAWHPTHPSERPGKRCKACRGEGRNLELVATCGNKEAVGVALVTLADEGEWDECPFGLMHRPAGETGVWKIKPWPASPRNVSDAGRLLRAQR